MLKLQNNTNNNQTEINLDEQNEEKYLIIDFENNSTTNKDANICHVKFMTHFLNNKNIKLLQTEQFTNNDINILFDEHNVYQNKGYLGRDEYQLCYEQHTFNIMIYESQTRGCKSQQYEKWLNVFCDYAWQLHSIVYIVDLALFKNGNSEYRYVLKYWYKESIPLDVELMIIKYITNECFVNDIKRLRWNPN